MDWQCGFVGKCVCYQALYLELNPLELTCWKDGNHSCKLFTDCHTHTVVCGHTHIHKVDLNKTLKEQKYRSYTLLERRLNTLILQNTYWLAWEIKYVNSITIKSTGLNMLIQSVYGDCFIKCVCRFVTFFLSFVMSEWVSSQNAFHLHNVCLKEQIN